MRPHHRAVEHLHHMRALAGLGQELEKRLEHPRAGEPPESLPDAVPVPKLRRQRPPGDVVGREVVQRLQGLTVVVTRFAPARLRSVEQFQHDLPIALCHPRQHGGLLDAGHAAIRTKPDSGIPLHAIFPYPSTRPSVSRGPNRLSQAAQLSAAIRRAMTGSKVC
jgi:hypothetical protein